MFKKQSYILLIALFFLNSCGDTWSSVKRGLTGQKQKTTEEFLVKKKILLFYHQIMNPYRRQAKDQRLKRNNQLFKN